MCPLQAALMILLTAQRQAAAGEMSLLAQPEVVQVLQSLVCSDNTASAAASPAAGKFCRSQYLLNLPSFSTIGMLVHRIFTVRQPPVNYYIISLQETPPTPTLS